MCYFGANVTRTTSVQPLAEPLAVSGVPFSNVKFPFDLQYEYTVYLPVQ
jgi:hypothetical protein